MSAEHPDEEDKWEIINLVLEFRRPESCQNIGDNGSHGVDVVIQGLGKKREKKGKEEEGREGRGEEGRVISFLGLPEQSTHKPGLNRNVLSHGSGG